MNDPYITVLTDSGIRRVAFEDWINSVMRFMDIDRKEAFSRLIWAEQEHLKGSKREWVAGKTVPFINTTTSGIWQMVPSYIEVDAMLQVCPELLVETRIDKPNQTE